MPVFRRQAAPPPVPGLSEWRPQPFGGIRPREVKDPIVEPRWGGVRVLVRLERDSAGDMTAVVTDEKAVDCTAEFADLAAAAGKALRVDEAVLDGYLTVEATQRSVGVMLEGPKALTETELASQFVLGRRPGPARRTPPDPDRPIAFVAVDLLRIDGSDLIDLPLLERKRLLEGALETDELVRVTPFVRPPVGSHQQTWFAQGFRELAYKPANGRYRVDGKPGDWATAPIRTR